MTKLLTVAIPTFNRKKLLDRLLRVIEPQISEEVEVLVSDNASTDGTGQLVAEKYPFVKYCCNEENIGSNRNFIECYKKATGKYVWLIGSDDVVTKDAIAVILHFIHDNMHQDVPIIFLNHNSFEGTYSSKTKFKEAFLRNKDKNYVVDTKKEFMSFADKQLTFMSALLLERRVFLEAKKPERYCKTHFLHTCIAFSANSAEKTKYGIIGHICVSQDLSSDNSPFNNNNEILYEIFGKWMKYVYAELAPQYGYEKKQMNRIYRHAMMKPLAYWTIKMKAKNMDNEKKAFWKYCYPAVKGYPISWFTIIPIAIMPRWISVTYLKLKNK